MTTISRLKVEVKFTETEIIESTATLTHDDRVFGVGNGEKEIIATAWGSKDNNEWEKIESKTVAPMGYENIILGSNHYLYVKLTARTTGSGETSIVDGYLTYTIPGD